MAAAAADDKADKVCVDRLADDSVPTKGMRHVTEKTGIGLFIYFFAVESFDSRPPASESVLPTRKTFLVF